VFKELEQQGRDAIAATSVKPHKITVKRAFDMRYVGQEHPVTVDLAPAVFRKRNRDAIKHHFDEVHQLRYGTSAPEERAEIVSLRATVTGLLKKPPLEKFGRGSSSVPSAAKRGTRPVYFDGKAVKTPAYGRDDLRAGNRISGPALVEEHASTTVLLPGDRMKVDGFGNLVIEVGKR